MKQVLLQLPAKDRYWVGTLGYEPRIGLPLVIHLLNKEDYVTSLIVRILKLADDDVYFIKTKNSTYKMTVSKQNPQVDT